MIAFHPGATMIDLDMIWEGVCFPEVDHPHTCLSRFIMDEQQRAANYLQFRVINLIKQRADNYLQFRVIILNYTDTNVRQECYM